MLRDIASFLIALGGVALVVGMHFRLQAFSRAGREAILAAAMGMFVISKYIAFATTIQDFAFAFGAAAYMAYLGGTQFKAFPRTAI